MMLLRKIVHNITIIIMVVLSTRPSFLAYLEVLSRNSTLVNKANGVAPRAMPAIKIITISSIFNLKVGFITFVITYKTIMLKNLPASRMSRTIKQKT